MGAGAGTRPGSIRWSSDAHRTPTQPLKPHVRMVKTATVMARSARKKMLEPKMPKNRPMHERQVMVGVLGLGVEVWLVFRRRRRWVPAYGFGVGMGGRGRDQSIDLGIEMGGCSCYWHAGPLWTTQPSTLGRPCQERSSRRLPQLETYPFAMPPMLAPRAGRSTQTRASRFRRGIGPASDICVGADLGPGIGSQVCL